MGISEEEPLKPESSSEEWVHRFVTAIGRGEINTVMSLLAEDVQLVSDGGGKAVAAVHPIETRDSVARFLFGITQKAIQSGGAIQTELASLNGQTGILIRTDDDNVTVVLIQVKSNKIRNIFFVRNPDKLTHLFS